ncbi:MAG: hypothetical protein KAS32_23470 [Candidatus Peribacteraceae bacterium]|nr:hypothetical protein [Candidatus Peribacteraceae bacterium]
MTVNAHFNHLSDDREQDLRQDLVVELIQMSGFDVYYFRRGEVNFDTIFGESSSVTFDDHSTIEMLLEDASEGFYNEQLSMFGLDIKDKIELAVARSRFTKETTLAKPLEGDLIYFPAPFDSLWEINLIKDKLFQQFGRKETWWLSCEKYQSSDDTITVPDQNEDLAGIPDMFTDEQDDSADLNDEGAEMDVFDTESPFGDLS